MSLASFLPSICKPFSGSFAVKLIPKAVQRIFLVTGLISLSFFPTVTPAHTGTVGLLESVRSALEHQPDIHFGRLDVEHAREQYREQSGQFDPTLRTGMEHGQTRSPLGASDYADYEKQTETSYYLGFEKQFRTGVTLMPELRTTRNELDRETPPGTPDLHVPQSRTGAYLIGTIPLMRGLGAEAAAGMETAARQDARIARTELKQVVSNVVHETTLAYWGYVRDYQNLEQRRIDEQTAREMHEQTRALVQADEVPAADLDESKANLSGKINARLNAKQALEQSRMELGMAMGVPFENIRDLPPPGDHFHLMEDSRDSINRLQTMALISYALDERHDLKASRGREASAATREKVFEDRTRPGLDLEMRAGYEGLDEGDSYARMPGSTGSNIRGMSWQMSLTYEFPVKNQAALGRLEQHRVKKRRQILQSRELSRDIQSSIHTTLAVLRENAAELENAAQTVELYEKTVQNQEMKYRMGEGTQLDLITTRDSLTQARLSQIDAYFRYARALSRLRFQTATLVSFVQDEARVELDHLIHPPLEKRQESGS